MESNGNTDEDEREWLASRPDVRVALAARAWLREHARLDAGTLGVALIALATLLVIAVLLAALHGAL